MDKPPRIPPAEAYRSSEVEVDLASDCAKIIVQMIHHDGYVVTENTPYGPTTYLQTEAYEPDIDKCAALDIEPLLVRLCQVATVAVNPYSQVEADQKYRWHKVREDYQVFSLQIAEMLEYEQAGIEPTDWQGVAAVAIKPGNDDRIEVEIFDMSTGRELDDDSIFSLLSLLSSIQEQRRQDLFENNTQGDVLPYPKSMSDKPVYQKFYPSMFIDGAPCPSCWKDKINCTHQENQPESN